MDILTGISIGLQVIGVATICLRVIAPITKTTLDNKLLEILTKVLKAVSLNLDESKIEIKVN